MADRTRSWQPVSMPTDIPKPVGAYSAGVRAGDFIFVSGQVPRDPRTGALAGSDFAAQTRQVFANIREVLGAAGATLDDVVSVIVYLTDVGDWGEFNDLYKQTFREPYPSRTAVGANLRGILVEVSAVAHRPAAG